DELDLDGGGLGHFVVLHKAKGAASGSAGIWAQPTDLRPVVKRKHGALQETSMTSPTELLRKLQVRAGSRLWLINVPQRLAEEISAGAEVEIVHEKDPYDGVLAFFDSAAEVEALAGRILAEMPEDGLLWAAYRKGPAGRGAGLTRDVGWAPFDVAGWGPGGQGVIGPPALAPPVRPPAWREG